MKRRKIIFMLLILLTGFAIMHANEVQKTEPVNMPMINFNFNDKPVNDQDKIMNNAVILKNVGTSFIAVGATGLGLSFAAAIVIAIYLLYYALIPYALLAVFGFMFVFGLMINAQSRRYLKKGSFFDSLENMMKAGIILSSIFGGISLLGIAHGVIYFVFYYNILGSDLLLPATLGLAFLSGIFPLAFFICALPMMITGLIFSNLKKRVSTVSYLDKERFAFTNGFSIKF